MMVVNRWLTAVFLALLIYMGFSFFVLPNRRPQCMSFPEYALYKKGLQRQKNIGLLVGSLEQRTLLVSRLNRLSTGRLLVVVFLHRFL